ncbi:MAG TPA: hypothetical protein VGE26_05735 [Sphingobacteriaceae bacterium]
MKGYSTLIILTLSFSVSFGQNIGGKWYGKLTQEPGGYRKIYDFELELVQDDNIRKDSITGVSYAYIPQQIEAKIGLSGFIDKDTIRLKESAYLIQDDVVPLGWTLCIKDLHLNYMLINNKEFLRGRWEGQTAEGRNCKPGLIILARSRKDLKNFIAENGYNANYPKSIVTDHPGAATGAGGKGGTQADGQHQTGFPDSAHSVNSLVPAFTGDFKNTSVSRISELEVENRELTLYLLDYSKVDNDSISVYFNRKLIIDKVAITEKPIVVTLTLDPGLPSNELLFYAQSLGDIPPNTAGIGIKDGGIMHKIKIESDLLKTSAVYLKPKPFPK